LLHDQWKSYGGNGGGFLGELSLGTWSALGDRDPPRAHFAHARRDRSRRRGSIRAAREPAGALRRQSSRARTRDESSRPAPLTACHRPAARHSRPRRESRTTSELQSLTNLVCPLL